MSIRVIILMIVALIGAVANFTSKITSEKFSISELKIKVASLIIVLVAVTLLMIFGK